MKNTKPQSLIPDLPVNVAGLLDSEQTPKLGGCSSDLLSESHNPVKSFECKLIPIASVEYLTSSAGNSDLIVQMVASLTTPWGRQLQPVLVQKNKSGHAKEWRLLDGLVRVLAAESAGWTHVLAVIFEGSDHGARFAVTEANFVRNHLNRYQLRKLASEWKNLWQSVHHEHKHGGDKAKHAAQKAANGLPKFEELIQSGGAGMKKSSFYRLVADYEGGSTSNSKVYGLEPTIIRPWLDSHPSAALCKKDMWLHRLATFPHEDQKQIAPYLEHYFDPNDAYFHQQRDEAAKKGKDLPLNESFPVFCEEFWENAKRIPDGTVDAVITDPNWELTADPVLKYWVEHGNPLDKKATGGKPIIKKMKPDDWRKLGQLTAKRLKLDGWAIFLIGQTNRHQIETILRESLNFVCTCCYVHSSGFGTPARKAGFSSHWRELLVFRRKDAPPVSDKTEFIHDMIPHVMKTEPNFAGLIDYLKSERDNLDKRISSLEVGGKDELLADIILSTRDSITKLYHPFGQSLEAFREIVRRFTKPNDFIWEPFCGGGTTMIAALTCFDKLKNDKGKWVWEHRPRKGIGCDAIQHWVQITKWRIDTQVVELLSQYPIGKAA